MNLSVNSFNYSNYFDNLALIINKGTGANSAWIKRDGSAWFKGNVTVDGTIANAELDTKLANLNNELVVAKELIVKSRETILELKSENVELKQNWLFLNHN